MSIKKFHVKSCDGSKTCSCPFRLDYRPLGLRGPHRRLNFPTKKEAERYRAETQVKAGRGEYIPPKAIPLFSAAATLWLNGKQDRHPSSLYFWRVVLEKHLSALNPYRLDQITPTIIEHLRDTLLKGSPDQPPLSPGRVRAIMAIASAIFKAANRKGLVSSNPAALAERPKPDPVAELDDDKDQPASNDARPDVLDASEIRKLLDVSEPGLWHTLFATAAATGMRSEELLALRWSEVELDNARLFVRRSVSWTRDEDQAGAIKPRFFGPKTKAGYRTIPLPAELISILRAWKLRCPKSPNDLVFSHPTDGGALRRGYVQTGMWGVCRRANLRRCSLGIFRHSFASGLLEKGVAITTVSGLMGHSSPAVTLNVYSHWLPHTSDSAVGGYASSFLSGAPAAPARERENSGSAARRPRSASRQPSKCAPMRAPLGQG
jgi:integrase